MRKAADTFLKLCGESEQLPDVFDFLSKTEGLSDRAQVDVLLVDQFQRWKHNQTIPVDQYLERTPTISDILKVELLIEEYGYLCQRGVAPSAEDFAKRFRHLSSEARLELYDGLELESLSDGGSSPSDSDGQINDSSKTASSKFIGRYQVVRTLGQGAFGKVYLAKDPDLDRSVAIKVPTRKSINMVGGAEGFLAEARAVAKLDHPNIVPVYDCGITEAGRCFVVSKYIRGKVLRAEIRKGIGHREAAEIIHPLARALHVAHVAGIVHRDVKPGNVIIDKDRQPHLLDFGLARAEQDENEEDALIGTPAYMSPEQAGGGGHRLDGRSDIYSLAVVFYEMLTGHRPCKSDKAADLIEQIKFGEVRPPRQSDDSIPIELERICLKALSREVSSRYNTAKDMADEIEAFLYETGSNYSTSSNSTSGSLSSFGSRSSVRSGRLATSPPSVAGSLLRSPWLVGVGLLLGFWAIISFTDPPWATPGASKLGPTELPAESTEPNHSVVNEVESDSLFSRRLAVLGFRNVSNDPDQAWLATGLTEVLTAELSKSDDLQVLPSDAVSSLKADLDLSDTESLGVSTLGRIKDRLGPRWVVLGSYTPAGEDLGQIRLDVVVQATSSKEILTSVSRSASTDQWLDLTVETCAQLRKQLGFAAPDLTRFGGLASLVPTNAEAFPDYYQGLAELRQLNPLGAHDLFLKAAKTDPNSAWAQHELAGTMSQLGDDLAARGFSQRAIELAEGLPKDQKLRINGRHHLLEGRPAEAVACFRELCDMLENGIDERLDLSEAMVAAGQGRAALAMLGDIQSNNLHDSERARLKVASAEAAQSISEYELQIQFSDEAAKLANKIGARLIEGKAMLVKGGAQRRLGKHQTAIASFDKAYKLLSSHGDRHNAAKALGGWSKALVDNGELDPAEAKIKEGLDLSKQLGNKRLLARYVGQLGELDVYRGKFDEARAQLRESIDNFVQLGDRNGFADMSLTLANVLARVGESDKAIEMIGKARETFQASGELRGEARTWGQQGAIHGRKTEREEAKRHFERALELFREVGDRQGEATVLADLATTYSSLGDLEKAGEYYSESLELLRQMASKRGPALVMFNLGVLYQKTGRIAEAKKLMAEALESFEKQGNHMNACFVQRKLADIQKISGDPASAKTTLNDVLEKSRSVGSVNVESATLASQGLLAALKGDFEKALSLQKQSKEIRVKAKLDLNAAVNELNIVRIEILQDRWSEASERLNLVFNELLIGMPEWKPALLSLRSRIASRLDQKTQAAAIFKEAEAAAKEATTEDKSILLFVKFERAKAMASLKRVDEAVAALDEVVKNASEYGNIETWLEARVERIIVLSNNARELDQTEVASCRKAASQLGFSEFAQRIESLLEGN